MRRLPLIITHYTLNTGYEKEVKKLMKSLKRLDLEYHLYPIERQGDWRVNSNWCSRCVQIAMSEFPKRDLLRVDADAVFLRRPVLFENDEWEQVDVGAVMTFFRWRPLPRGEMLGGTLYFAGDRPHVRWLVDEWTLRATVTQSRVRNPDILRKLMENEFKDKIHFRKMPLQYCKIFDHMKEVKDGVILHNQASRRFKKIINRMNRALK